MVFETHAMTLDNDQGHATGWLPGQLSERGLEQARQLGRRRARDGIAAVFSSDLARATQTATEAFAGREISVLYDWRLRECDYGQRNGMPVAELHWLRYASLIAAAPEPLVGKPTKLTAGWAISACARSCSQPSDILS